MTIFFLQKPVSASASNFIFSPILYLPVSFYTDLPRLIPTVFLNR